MALDGDIWIDIQAVFVVGRHRGVRRSTRLKLAGHDASLGDQTVSGLGASTVLLLIPLIVLVPTHHQRLCLLLGARQTARVVAAIMSDNDSLAVTLRCWQHVSQAYNTPASLTFSSANNNPLLQIVQSWGPRAIGGRPSSSSPPSSSQSFSSSLPYASSPEYG